jgi:hypothetical protein
VNRDSGTDRAIGGWLQRLVRPYHDISLLLLGAANSAIIRLKIAKTANSMNVFNGNPHFTPVRPVANAYTTDTIDQITAFAKAAPKIRKSRRIRSLLKPNATRVSNTPDNNIRRKMSIRPNEKS